MNSTTKKQLITVAILAVLNFLISNLVTGNGRTLEGHVVMARSPEMRSATITTLFFGIQLLSFVLGALFAAIPYKSKSYLEKWVAVSLGIAICVQAVVFLMGIAKMLNLLPS